MHKVQLSLKQIIELAIMGFDNGNTEAARNLLQELHDRLVDSERVIDNDQTGGEPKRVPMCKWCRGKVEPEE